METTEIIILKKYGISLAASAVAYEITDDLINKINNNEIHKIIFDFEDIEIMSTGFSYGLFKNLLVQLGNKFSKVVRIRNIQSKNNNYLKEIINIAIGAVIKNNNLDPNCFFI